MSPLKSPFSAEDTIINLARDLLLSPSGASTSGPLRGKCCSEFEGRSSCPSEFVLHLQQVRIQHQSPDDLLSHLRTMLSSTNYLNFSNTSCPMLRSWVSQSSNIELCRSSKWSSLWNSSISRSLQKIWKQRTRNLLMMNLRWRSSILKSSYLSIIWILKSKTSSVACTPSDGWSALRWERSSAARGIRSSVQQSSMWKK